MSAAAVATPLLGRAREAAAREYWHRKALQGQIIGPNPCESNGKLAGKLDTTPVGTFLKTLARKIGILCRHCEAAYYPCECYKSGSCRCEVCQ